MDAFFLDLDGVEGESQSKGYEKKIELLSFNDGVAMQVTGDVSNQERTSGKPMFQDVTVTKYLDKSSPLLMQACCEGKIFKTAKIFMCRNDNGEFIELLRYELENPVISSVSTGGGNGDKPVDSLSLNFAKITWVHTAQKEDGSKEGEIPGVFDASTNSAA